MSLLSVNEQVDPEFACTDCHVDVVAIGESWYMLTDRIWQQIRGRGMLCLGCVEQRLGRPLEPNDFSHALANQSTRQHGPRLRNRLRGKVFLPDIRLPKGRWLRHFAHILGVTATVEPCSHPMIDLHTHVVLRRGPTSVRITVFGLHEHASARTGEFLRHLEFLSSMRSLPPDLIRFQRRARRDRGRAEMAIRLLLDTHERECLRHMMLSLKDCDHELPEHIWEPFHHTIARLLAG